MEVELAVGVAVGRHVETFQCNRTSGFRPDVTKPKHKSSSNIFCLIVFVIHIIVFMCICLANVPTFHQD